MFKKNRQQKDYFKLSNSPVGIACKEYHEFITTNFLNQEFQSSDMPKINRSFFHEGEKSVTFAVSTSELETIAKDSLLGRMCEIGLLKLTKKVNGDKESIWYSLTPKGKKVTPVFEA